MTLIGCSMAFFCMKIVQQPCLTTPLPSSFCLCMVGPARMSSSRSLSLHTVLYCDMLHCLVNHVQKILQNTGFPYGVVPLHNLNLNLGCREEKWGRKSILSALSSSSFSSSSCLLSPPHPPSSSSLFFVRVFIDRKLISNLYRLYQSSCLSLMRAGFCRCVRQYYFSACACTHVLTCSCVLVSTWRPYADLRCSSSGGHRLDFLRKNLLLSWNLLRWFGWICPLPPQCHDCNNMWPWLFCWGQTQILVHY